MISYFNKLQRKFCKKKHTS